MTKLRKPCENCPWRKDAPRAYWDSQHFIDIWNNCQGDSMHVMLCHKSRVKAAQNGMMPDGTECALMCQGWIRVMGFDAIGVRIAAMNDQITVEEVEDTKTVDLFPSFAAMLCANKIKIPRFPRYKP